jgi:hypothetical protein
MKSPGGLPLAHERVTIIDPDSAQPVGDPVVTDSDGRFAVRVPEQKNYHLRIEGEHTDDRQRPDDHEVENLLCVRFFTLAGKPLAGETVKITGHADALTDEDGEIRVPMPAGEYELDVGGVKFWIHTMLAMELGGTLGGTPYEFVAGDAFILSAELQSPGGEPIAHEKVTVVDPDTGEAVTDAVKTDADGRIAVAVPEDKKYHIKIHDEGTPVERKQPADKDIENILCAQFFDPDHRPLAGEKVKVRGPSGPSDQVTGDDGSLHLPASPGEYELVVRGQTFLAYTLLVPETDYGGKQYQFVVEEGG